jgi:hypothetical protein
MSPFEIGAISVVAMVAMIYLGVYIPIALGVVSFVTIWILRDSFELPMALLKIAVGDSVTEYSFATIPLFTFMGLIVSKAGMGEDVYRVMNTLFYKIVGGVGMATVGANALFAAVTGSSIASASVFTKVAVPEMMKLNYNKRFAVGVVAGSSVLGMIIPPSAMLIIYAIVAEQSVGHMFLAGVIPGIMLAIAYIIAIWGMSKIRPSFVVNEGRGPVGGGRTAQLGQDGAFVPAASGLGDDGPWRDLHRLADTGGGRSGGCRAGPSAGACAAQDRPQGVLERAAGNRPHHGGHPDPDHGGLHLQPDAWDRGHSQRAG